MRKFISLVLFLCSFYLHASSCTSNAGMADSYVLALSEQPGFCETYGYDAGKPECQHISANSYESSHFTLHGLWPNQEACGQSYGFCTVKPRNKHCDYPPVSLSEAVSTDLKQIMPSYRIGSCLERHEWNKHGSCQILSSTDYFALALRLATEADNSIFGHFLSEHHGLKVKLSALHEQIAQAFGVENVHKVYLGCTDGILVDIYFSLPALIPFSEGLDSLIAKAPDYALNDRCPATVLISNFTGDNTST